MCHGGDGLRPDQTARLNGARRAVLGLEKAASVRVLIVDDHPIVRYGLRRLLEDADGIEPVGEAGSGREALLEARSLTPDVIVLDIVMPDQSGLEVLPMLMYEHPQVKVLLVSRLDKIRYVREGFDAGASGYVLKDAAEGEVVTAIREIARGGRYFSAALGMRLVIEEAEARWAERDPLSEREHEVLHLLALGHTNHEVARQLFISARTAEAHRSRILQKLQLQSRADLVRYAITHGLLLDDKGALTPNGRPTDHTQARRE
jgi:two-component system, NarL family, response regulator NreC